MGGERIQLRAPAVRSVVVSHEQTPEPQLPAGVRIESRVGAPTGVSLRRLDPPRQTLTEQAYDALHTAIADIPLYDGHHDGHLDERALAAQLGISRTPVREALLRLQVEGIVRMVPRRGVFLVRKSKDALIEVILASAALESMAARLAAARASDEDIASLRTQFLAFGTARSTGPKAGSPQGSAVQAAADPPLSIDEYSALNVAFHQRIVDLAHSELFSTEVARLLVHMRAIRHSTIGDAGRMARSVVDHMHIVEALEARDADLVERYVRQHALQLAEHVRTHLPEIDPPTSTSD
jgi:DNA-binding GntR family transcriptional regulator